MDQVVGIQQAIEKWGHRLPSPTQCQELCRAVRAASVRVERVCCGLWSRSPLLAVLRRVIPSRGALQAWQIEVLLASLSDPRSQPSLRVYVARRCACLLEKQVLSVQVALRIQGVVASLNTHLSRHERRSFERYCESLDPIAKLQLAHDAVRQPLATSPWSHVGVLEGCTLLLRQVMTALQPNTLSFSQIVQLAEVWEYTMTQAQQEGLDPEWVQENCSLWEQWMPTLDLLLMDGPDAGLTDREQAQAREKLFLSFFRVLISLAGPSPRRGSRWQMLINSWSARHLRSLSLMAQREVMAAFSASDLLWRQCAAILPKETILCLWTSTLPPEAGPDFLLDGCLLTTEVEAATRLPTESAHWEALFRGAIRAGQFHLLREFLLSFCGVPIPHVFSDETIADWVAAWKSQTDSAPLREIAAAEWAFWLQRSLQATSTQGHGSLCEALLPQSRVSPHILQTLLTLPHRAMVQWLRRAACKAETNEDLIETAAALRRRAFRDLTRESPTCQNLQRILERISGRLEEQERLASGHGSGTPHPTTLRALASRGQVHQDVVSFLMGQVRRALPEFNEASYQLVALCRDLMRARPEAWREELEQNLLPLQTAPAAVRRAWLDFVVPLCAEGQARVAMMLDVWLLEDPVRMPLICAWAAKTGASRWLTKEVDWLLEELSASQPPDDPIEAWWACCGLLEMEQQLANTLPQALLASLRRVAAGWQTLLPASTAALKGRHDLNLGLLEEMKARWGPGLTMEQVPEQGPHSDWLALLRLRQSVRTLVGAEQPLLEGWRDELVRGWQQMCELLTQIRESCSWSPIALEAYQWAVARVVSVAAPGPALGLALEVPLPMEAEELELLRSLRRALRPTAKRAATDWHRAWWRAREDGRVEGALFAQLPLLNLLFRGDWRPLPAQDEPNMEVEFPEHALLTALEGCDREERKSGKAHILRLKAVLVEGRFITALEQRDRAAWTRRQNMRLSRILKALDRDSTVSIFWPHLGDALEGCASRWAEGLRRLEERFCPYSPGAGSWTLSGLTSEWVRVIRRDMGALKVAELLVGSGSVHSQNLILARAPRLFGIGVAEWQQIRRDVYVESSEEIEHEDLQMLLQTVCSPRVLVEEVAQRLAALPWLRDSEEEPSIMVVLERLAQRRTDSKGRPLEPEARDRWISAHADWMAENQLTAESCQPLALELCLAEGWLHHMLVG